MIDSRKSDAARASPQGVPPGMTAVGIFLFFGATMASFAAVTLLWPGTVLDRAWVLNPVAQRQLLPYRQLMGPTFVMLSMALVLAGVGWFRRRTWGWWLTVVIIATQLLGDAVNLFRGDFLRGVVGVVIAGLLMSYLVKDSVRRRFHSGPQ